MITRQRIGFLRKLSVFSRFQIEPWDGTARNLKKGPRSIAEASERTSKRRTTMKSSTQDKVHGTVKEAKGRVKESAGTAAGNPNLRDEGTADRVEGRVQKKAGDVKKVFGK